MRTVCHTPNAHGAARRAQLSARTTNNFDMCGGGVHGLSNESTACRRSARVVHAAVDQAADEMFYSRCRESAVRRPQLKALNSHHR
ncbi:hypothetical protein GY45DRAFT_305892 [Cubamyces sp. BRFM 1775]|nr:hypothetical protein GY45DRAFT_305892 [Cubamyces sp. BRFM 1775]